MILCSQISQKMFFLRLSEGCIDLSVKIVRLKKSFYFLKQASRTWHAHVTIYLKGLGFEQCKADVCVFRLIVDWHGAITAVVHVNDMFAVGRKDVCDRLSKNLVS